jgi:ubiquitin carboxyl-terminal hydrolase 7
MKELVLPTLIEEPRTIDDQVHTWSVEGWLALPKKEHGPIFHAGGYPWYVILTISPP